MFRNLLRVSSFRRNAMLVVSDFTIFAFSVWFGISLRRGGWADIGEYWLLSLLVALCSVVIYALAGVYKLILRYLDERAMIRIGVAALIAALNIALLLFWVPGIAISTPRSVIVIFALTAFVLTVGCRLTYRLVVNAPEDLLDVLSSRKKILKNKNVVIYGAGEAGVSVMSSLRSGFEYNPIAFIDDDPAMQSRKISDLPVLPRERFADFCERHLVHEVLIALPTSNRSTRNEVVTWLKQFNIRLQSVPAYEDIAAGTVQIEDIQDVDVADLLGREASEPNQELMQADIKGRTVLVTGAGGSIGSELSRTVIKQAPEVLILYDFSEFHLYQIQQELEQWLYTHQSHTKLVVLLGSVHDELLLENLFTRYTVDTLYHAAAYKHVPMVEHNLSAAIHNNVFGTVRLAERAMAHQVGKFILVSTDKAVRPTNVMGATKRLAELALQALASVVNADSSKRPAGFNGSRTASDSGSIEYQFSSADPLGNPKVTQFAMVRFGNVLDSSGSVIPLFRKQIKQGGPITVTHPDITRYFMTIPEAAALVVQAGALARGGEVYLLDMGQPVKIADLARNLIELSGLTIKDANNRGGDIEIQYTGLRPGEKLYEELLIKGDKVVSTENPDIYLSSEPAISWEDYQYMIEQLEQIIRERDYQALIALLRQYVDGFTPQDNVFDHTWRSAIAA